MQPAAMMIARRKCVVVAAAEQPTRLSSTSSRDPTRKVRLPKYDGTRAFAAFTRAPSRFWSNRSSVAVTARQFASSSSPKRKNNHGKEEVDGPQQTEHNNDKEQDRAFRLQKKWEASFQLLCKYKERHGDCLVPRLSDFPMDDEQENAENQKENSGISPRHLGEWVNKQRMLRREMEEGQPSTMTAERIAKLDSLGFDWNPKESHWEELYSHLKRYHRQHGHCNVPQLATVEGHVRLGKWVQQQRIQYKLLQQGKRSRMTQKRIEMLEQINFDWNPLATKWNERLEQLREFKAANGHFNAPRDHPLGRWVLKQREFYRNFVRGKKRGASITQERIDKLDAIGFHW